MHKTILIVTHDMEQVYNYCDEVVVMEHGKVKLQQSVDEFFSHPEQCIELHILPPDIIRMKTMLKEKGFKIGDEIRDVQALAKCIARQVKHG